MSEDSPDWIMPPDYHAPSSRPVSPLWRRLGRVLLILFAVLITGVAVGGFFLPRRLVVTRSIEIHAPATTVYDLVNSLQRWPEWAPWWERDPFLETDYSGPQSGRGAMLAWRSRKEGEGRLKITSTSPSQQVLLAMDFGDQGDAVSAIRLTESGGITTVEWTWETDAGQNTGRRYYSLLLRPALEKDFDEGLAALKRVSESGAPGGSLPGTKKTVNGTEDTRAADPGKLPRKDSNLE